jgi:hypothetical protein
MLNFKLHQSPALNIYKVLHDSATDTVYSALSARFLRLDSLNSAEWHDVAAGMPQINKSERSLQEKLRGWTVLAVNTNISFHGLYCEDTKSDL